MSQMIDFPRCVRQIGKKIGLCVHQVTVKPFKPFVLVRIIVEVVSVNPQIRQFFGRYRRPFELYPFRYFLCRLLLSTVPGSETVP